MPSVFQGLAQNAALASNWPTDTDGEGSEIFRLSYWRGGLYRRGPLMDNQTIPNPSDLAPSTDVGRAVNRYRPAPYVGSHYGGNGPALVIHTRDEPNTNDYSGAQGWDIYRHSIPPGATVIRYGVRAAFDPAWGSDIGTRLHAGHRHLSAQRHPALLPAAPPGPRPQHGAPLRRLARSPPSPTAAAR
jgi:hypothetical protein